VKPAKDSIQKPSYSFGRTAISSINPAWIIIKLVAAIPI
jgi:hypothetical protein